MGALAPSREPRDWEPWSGFRNTRRVTPGILISAGAMVRDRFRIGPTRSTRAMLQSEFLGPGMADCIDAFGDDVLLPDVYADEVE